MSLYKYVAFLLKVEFVPLHCVKANVITCIASYIYKYVVSTVSVTKLLLMPAERTHKSLTGS